MRVTVRRWLASITAVALSMALAACSIGATENVTHASAVVAKQHAPEVSAHGRAPTRDVPQVEIHPVAEGATVATTAVDRLPIFDDPTDRDARMALGRKTIYEAERTLLVIGDATVAGDEWFEVLLPLKPNGQTGWVRADDVTTSTTDIWIDIQLDERTLTLYEGAEALLTTPVAIGTWETPTPVGTFYVTDPVDLRTNPGSVYGPYALGLSGYSEVLDDFGGGLPQIAIHGNNEPSSIGQASSNGCIRLPNDVILEVAQWVELGTPVTIS